MSRQRAPAISIESEIQRIRATVPVDRESAQRYAARLHDRWLRDQRKMQQAAARLLLLADLCREVGLREILLELAESLAS